MVGMALKYRRCCRKEKVWWRKHLLRSW